MKKMCLSLLLMIATLVSAQNYSGRYSGTLNIGGEESSNSVLVFPGSDAQHINFILPDFSFGALNLGDIALINVPVSNTGAMAMTDFPFYIPLLNEHVGISIVDYHDDETDIESGFSGSAVTVVLMIETTTLPETLPVLFMGTRQNATGYQARNAGFENWEDVTDGQEPTNWNGFSTGSGTWIGSAKNDKQLKSSAIVRPGSAGTKSCVITSNMVLGVKANGNVTTGRINAGSMSASDASGNYNYTDASDGDFRLPFTGHPDSLVFWTRFVPADQNATNTNNEASVKAILHGNGNYHDPESSTVNNGISKFAEASTPIQPTSDFPWVRVAKNFNYTDSVDEATKYMLITFTTCSTPGGGSTYKAKTGGTFLSPIYTYYYDSLYIDDMEMIYNSKLSSLTIDGAPVAFDANGQATLNNMWSDVDYTIAASAANQYATEYHGYDPINHTLVVMVAGEDFIANPASCHTYTIQFANPKYARPVTADNYGTICLPAAVAADKRSGAEFYSVAGVREVAGQLVGIVLDEVAEDAELAAGTPYIFKATDTNLALTMNGALTDVQPATALVGNLSESPVTVPQNRGCYILKDNELHSVGNVNVTVGTNRAYIDLSNVSEAPASAAGRRVVVDIEGANATTDIEHLEAQESIDWNKPVYNVLGQQVGRGTTGVLIQNGIKFIVR